MTIPRSLVVGDHMLIGDIIADSFSDDPVNRWVFKEQVAMTPFYTQVARKLYLPRGYGHVMEDGSGGALWLPPGVKKHIPLWNSIDTAVSMIRHAGFMSIARGTGVDEGIAKYKPQEPHYYLFAIGARSNQQGKGVGGKLMIAGLERADQAGMPSYLESSKESNVSFYRRFGFEVIEKVVPTKGCPPFWLMWREAR
ncbi:MAG: GNAT family N-acetyltransferase [Halioglobus sp.]